MKTIDTIFRYSAGNRRHDGLCRLRVFMNSKNRTYALITDIGSKNPSLSVTNAIEKIVNQLYEKGMLLSEATIVEHYEHGMLTDSGTFDFVKIVNGRPEWFSTNIDNVMEELECDSDELISKVSMIPHLDKMIIHERHKIDPHLDFESPENHEITSRRYEIKNNSIKKSKIQKLINDRVTEQEISNLLKRDLSVFGEMYSTFGDNYICFSEFPLGEGKIDYVVFTGVSRMDVFLIEVKGANFNAFTSNHYNKPTSKIEEASNQLRDRLSVIYRDYEKFRKNVHTVREAVVNGKNMYNSFLGPQGDIGVDPNKDVYVHVVLIGGRTVDDIKESQKRHDFELNSHPRIKFETWDSWLKKLNRE